MRWLIVDFALSLHLQPTALSQPIMIVVKGSKVFQIIVAGIVAYSLLSLLFGHSSETSWSRSLPDFSYNPSADGVFGHIQNETLGVSMLRFAPHLALHN